MGKKEFTLHSLVTKSNQKLTEKLKKGEITIKAEEKAAQFGQTSVSFDVKADLKNCSSKVFFTLSKQGSGPMYKSECKKPLKGKYVWNTVLTNSHLLADDNDESKVEISTWEYSSSGKHRVVGKFFFEYGELK